jgi:hypothetical protein
MGAVDEAGFRDLLDRHLPDLWRFARRRVGSADDADDVAAETFAVAWRRRGQLPAEVGVEPACAVRDLARADHADHGVGYRGVSPSSWEAAVR